MSIFGKIMGAIFGTSAVATPAAGGSTPNAGSAAGSSAAPAASVEANGEEKLGRQTPRQDWPD